MSGVSSVSIVIVAVIFVLNNPLISSERSIPLLLSDHSENSFLLSDHTENSEDVS